MKQIKDIIEYFDYTNRVDSKETRKVLENIINDAIRQDREERAIAKRLQKYE